MTVPTSYFALMDVYSDTANSTADLLAFGKLLATMARDFFNVVVPEYNKSTTTPAASSA